MSTYRGSPVHSAKYNRKDDTYSLINSEGKIIAVLKRHEYLSQPQLRTLRLTNGKYRRPRAAFRGSPAGQSHLAVAPGTIVFPGPGATWIPWIGADEATRQPIEDAGIRAGEVIAQRCWRVVDDGLYSISVREAWLPDQPMTGDVRDEYGVHAFKQAVDLEEYIFGLKEPWINLSTGKIHRPKVTPIAIGTIALWGEIVEHERGYRAEFGKVIGIDGVIDTNDDTLIDRLRARYNLTQGQR